MGNIDRLRDNLNKYFVGKEQVVENLLICMLAGGHVLIEDVPGCGKTTLAAILAKSISCSFGRIQCTPDTLPGDITGVNIYNVKTGEFEYTPGVIMNQILMADELNRATPKTQASLLEAMAEGQVTVDGTRHQLPDFFLVIATQNPTEYVGTYSLPEAQIDRFFMRLSLGYMLRGQEMEVLSRRPSHVLVEALSQVVTAEETRLLRQQAEEVTVSPDVLNYIMDIVDYTRRDGAAMSGVSTRGAIALYRACQVTAAMQGRDYVIPEDVKAEALPVLGHRVVMGLTGNTDAEELISSMLAQIPVPLEEA